MKDLMNRRSFLQSCGLASTVLLLPIYGIPADCQPVYNGSTRTMKPSDNLKAMVNPYMGWTMHFYSNMINNYGSKLHPSDTLDFFPGLSTVYLRVPWAFLEPEEGRFNWELLDTPAQRWIDRGQKVAFRITAQESWMRFATPEWVMNAGARGIEVDRSRYDLWEPVYDDPVFLDKVENFVEVMAERYDGNPHVAFVDIGHFGMWGEGHTVTTTKIEYPLEVLKKHIDIYLKYFKETLLCISDDFAGHNKPGSNFPITDYAFSKGVTIRDDSIMVQPPPESWYHAEMARLFWPQLPVILEHDHYGQSVRANAWNKEIFLKSIEEYHASYMSIHWWPDVFWEENKDVIEQINLRMGYRLQLNEISLPDEATIGEPFRVATSWSNAGVAPCYPGGFPCYTLKDEKRGIVSVLVDDRFDFWHLQVGPPGEAPRKDIESCFIIGQAFADPVKTFFRTVQPGTHTLYFSVGKMDGTPVFELPYDGNDGHNRYPAGKINLKERSLAECMVPGRSDTKQ